MSLGRSGRTTLICTARLMVANQDLLQAFSWAGLPFGRLLFSWQAPPVSRVRLLACSSTVLEDQIRAHHHWVFLWWRNLRRKCPSREPFLCLTSLTESVEEWASARGPDSTGCCCPGSQSTYCIASDYRPSLQQACMGAYLPGRANRSSSRECCQA